MSEPEEAKQQSSEDALYDAASASVESPMSNAMKRPAPVDRTPAGSHGSYQATSAQPETEPLDWRQFVKPRSPGPDYKVVDGLDAGTMPTLSSNTHRDVATDSIRAHNWIAYTTESREVDAQQRTLASAYRTFMDAHNNGDVQALGFVVPSGWHGDLAALADSQRFAGTTRGELFGWNGSLNGSADDQRAAEQARTSSSAKSAHDKTVRADHELQSKLSSLDAKRNDVDTHRQKIVRAVQHIEVVKLRHEVSDDQGELEEAKKHAEGVKASLEFVVGGLMKFAIAGEAGDILESVGAMASYAVGKVSTHSIADAEAKLAADTKKLHSKEAEEARQDLEIAKADARTSLLLLKSAREDVLVAMSSRQLAYESAGKASAAASGANGPVRGRIAGAMAAIPSVELVIGLARNLAELAEDGPRYTSAAGSGFHAAMYDQKIQASNFVGALNQIEYVKQHFRALARSWSTRLASLQKTQVQLGGQRPADREEQAPVMESESE